MSAEATHRPGIAQWTTWAPILGAVVLAATWGRSLPGVVAVLVTAALFGAVLAAVHHAEVIAAKVGEPLGSIVLAVAVTVIEVGLIVTLMASGKDGVETLARDTVFAAASVSGSSTTRAMTTPTKLCGKPAASTACSIDGDSTFARPTTATSATTSRPRLTSAARIDGAGPWASSSSSGLPARSTGTKKSR